MCQLCGQCDEKREYIEQLMKEGEIKREVRMDGGQIINRNV